MTATQTEAKWTAQDLGKIQAKRFNEAVSRFNWQAKTIREITDFGEHDVTPMFSGSPNPLAAPLMAAIREKYALLVTGDNYMDIIADIQAATKELAANPVIVDKRTTPEERAEHDRAREEREAKAAAEAARIAQFKTHTYDTVEAAKELKRVLSIVWPSVKFSVKSERYSGGYSITPSWTDGPTGEQVRKITQWFQNKSFDGMIDMESTNKPNEWHDAAGQGHRFEIRGGYVHGSRNTSAALLLKCVERFVAETGLEAPAINNDNPAYPSIVRDGGAKPCGWSLYVHDAEYPEGTLCRDECSNWTVADLVGQMTHHVGLEPAYPLERDTVFRILLGELGGAAVSNVGQSEGGVTVTENEEKNGVELRFPSKPSAEVLSTLKANGFRWGFTSKCWYAKRTPVTLAFAQQIAGLSS